jgi:CRP/FNR family cyclic AMP-dependent transcriptional regulator
MACNANELRHIPLFALLDDEELAVLASQVELRRFAARKRIYKIGDQDGQAYVLKTTRKFSSIRRRMANYSASPP